MAGITEREAYRLLEGSSKFFHSVLVARIMEVLAPGFAAVPQDWSLVGLLHDLDKTRPRRPATHGQGQ
jgi:predicted hydrolase (HD superfamily)